VSEGKLRVGQVGLGYWGRNLARVFDDIADLTWLCDSSDELREEFAQRYPEAQVTAEFGELLAADDVDAVVIATPVPTHYPLARAVLEAGKHVFVEKPPAMHVSEMEELIGLAESRGLVLMPGHLLLYHPAVQKLKELVEDGELGEVLVVYGNRQNLGKIRKDENALWSLGVHDLSVILHLIQEEIVEADAHGRAFLNPGVEDVVFCYLRFASGKIAHMHLSWLDPHKMRRLTVVGRDKMAVFDDMELDQKITVYDKAPEQPSDTYGEWRTRTGDTFSPQVSNAEPLKLECQHFVRLVQEGWDGREMRDGLEVVRTLELLTENLHA
jgi:predicted dehydrogenase